MPAPRLWRIYHVTRRSDGRGYVGVTCRSLATRLAAHVHLTRRHPHLGRPGTLAAAIRAATEQGLSFAEAFLTETLDDTCSPDAARSLERDWIARLGTAWPRGFNVQPGGASLGGPANARPVTLRHPERGVVRYPSLLAAVIGLDEERRAAGQPPLSPGVVYARRAMGWSPEEALGLVPHQDGRGLRGDIRWQGQPAASLRALARAQGIAPAALRSRLHRARRRDGTVLPDLARDRRHSASRRMCGQAARPPCLALPHWPRPGQAGIAWAFGFRPGARPRGGAPVGP